MRDKYEGLKGYPNYPYDYQNIRKGHLQEQTQNNHQKPKKPWASPWKQVTKGLKVEVEEGLSESEVKDRRRKYGSNRLREAQQRSAWQILVEQFKSILVILLAVAAGVSLAFGETVDAIAIFSVILINAVIGFFTELRAVRSMEALRELSQVESKVRRAGKIKKISAEALVPGDIVILESGDVVTADIRLLETSKLQANESALTGESLPVSKATEPVDESTILAERSSMVYKGTAITRGSGEGVVVATGMETELGHISSLVEEAQEEITPLEKRLDKLGQRLVWGTLAIASLIALIGILIGKDPLLIVETAIALAVATVPEGLPIVATIALARGMWRMSQRNALVRQLSAVETLGSTTVILTDKTGTLTENEMSVVELELESGEIEIQHEETGEMPTFRRNGKQVDPSQEPLLLPALEVGMLCNNASLSKDSDQENKGIGDPSEIALLEAAEKAGLDREEVLAKKPEVREIAFDPEVKMMATLHQLDGRYQVAVKGAPEAVMASAEKISTPDGERELKEADRNNWEKRVEKMAQDGLRVLALASKEVQDQNSDPYDNLTLLGLVGLLDPPREDVKEAIQACKNAGVRVIMVTGDQALTAQKIAQAVELVEDPEPGTINGQDLATPDQEDEEEIRRLLQNPIFARVEPKQKLDLVSTYQESGEVVAMTGDGVNDAPALKKADIGIAMGIRGTQVAREAADMVLKDDAFSTIVAAVEGGRVIFNNIRKFVIYLLSCNVSEILVVSLASLANAPLPIRPLQILYLNLVTDVFPALALGVGEGDQTIMKRPPRDPEEPMLLRHHWWSIGGYSSLITLAVLGAFALALVRFEMDTQRAVTISFLTLASAQLWHVFNMRGIGSGFIRNEVTRNPFVWGALILCMVLLLAAVYLPGLSDLLATVDPEPTGWLLVLGMSLLPWAIGQILKNFGWGEI